MIEIEKGIPAPKTDTINIAKLVRELEVGDSFVVESKRIPSVYQAAIRAKFKMSRRSIEDNKFRVWRIA